MPNKNYNDEELMKEALSTLKYFFSVYENSNEQTSVAINIINKLKERLNE